MPRSLAVLAVAAIGLLPAGRAGAQSTAAGKPGDDTDQVLALFRKDLRAEKADVVAKSMQLDAGQAAVFWPIYKAYEAERESLGDQRLRLITDLTEQYDRLDDAKAKALLDRSLAIEHQRLALYDKYKGPLLKVLPAKTVARFFQVENRIDNLINLKISSGIPLVY